MRMRLSESKRFGLGAAAIGAAFGWPMDARADPATPAPAEQQRAEKETELRGVEDTMRASDEQRRAIEAQIESIRADRARLSAALIETTAKVQEAERGVAAADDRLTGLNAKADRLVGSLESRRDQIATVLAALQRMGTHPPPAILVKPQDMAEAIRAASVLGSMIVNLKSETEALSKDIDDLGKTRQSIAREREGLARTTASLALEKTRLSALIEARQKSLSSAEEALGSQQKRAADLARQATSLKDLMTKLDAENSAQGGGGRRTRRRRKDGARDRGESRGRARTGTGAAEARSRLRRRQGPRPSPGRRHDPQDIRRI